MSDVGNTVVGQVLPTIVTIVGAALVESIFPEVDYVVAVSVLLLCMLWSMVGRRFVVWLLGWPAEDDAGWTHRLGRFCDYVMLALVLVFSSMFIILVVREWKYATYSPYDMITCVAVIGAVVAIVVSDFLAAAKIELH